MPRCGHCFGRWRGFADICPYCHSPCRPESGPFPLSSWSPLRIFDGLMREMTCQPLSFAPGHSHYHPEDPVRTARPVTPSQLGHRDIRSGDIQNETKCSICLEQFKRGERVCELPCKHIFHDDCVREWLSREATCPVCRKKLGPSPPRTAEAPQNPLPLWTHLFGF
jgi:hypothetical protein